MSFEISDGLAYDEIALEGARLINEFFPAPTKNVLRWSPWRIPYDTGLVYDYLYDPDGQQKRFKAQLRHFFSLAGFRELSYVEHFDEISNPLWVMLVADHPGADLSVGVDLCRWASFGWSLRQFLRLQQYPRKRLHSMLKLLVPAYPKLDLDQPLDQLILP